MFNLPSTQALINQRIKQMGLPFFVRHCKNLGISFEDTYTMIFNTMPKGA